MKKIILLLLVSICSLSVYGQFEIDRVEKLLLEKEDTSGLIKYKGLVSLSSGYNINSNAITNSFLSALLYGTSDITDGLKDQVSGRLKSYNRVGADFNVGADGMYKTKKLTYVIGLHHREFANSTFTNDMFELVFKGNKEFVGQTANIGDFKLRYFDYQNLYVGVLKNIESKKMTIGGGLSFIRGGRYQEVDIKNGSLYTDPNGYYIDMNANVNTASSPNNNLGASNGLGGAVNLYFSVKHKKNQFNVEVRDLGFITWKNQTVYSGDSSYRFEGYKINDVLSPNTSLTSGINSDSIITSLGIKKSTQNITMMLPATFHVNYVFNPNKRFSRIIGVKYMVNSSYVPRVYIKGMDYFKHGFILVNTVSYGGWGRFDWEVGLMKNFKNSFVVSLNAFVFEYLVLPGHSSGHGFNFSLTKLF